MSLNIRRLSADQARVFDIADPDRHGVLLKAGSEVSEVRYEDGAVRNVVNDHLRPVEAPPVTDNGFSQLNPSPSNVVRLGQEAMARKRRGWDDWLLIAEALQAGRTEVMRELHTNEASGRRYEKAMGDWLATNGFKEINKATRSQLLDCLKHKVEIEKWRSQLTDQQRFKFNHPDTVLKKWKAATVVPDPNAPPRVSPVQKLKDTMVSLGGGEDGQVEALPPPPPMTPKGQLDEFAKPANTPAQQTTAQSGLPVNEVQEPSLAEELNDDIPDFGNEEATPDKGATKVPKGAVLESVAAFVSGKSMIFRGHNIDPHSGRWIVSKDGKKLHRADNEGAARAWVNELLNKKPAKTSAKKPPSKRPSNILDAG
jgi:hypothetical protein